MRGKGLAPTTPRRTVSRRTPRRAALPRSKTPRPKCRRGSRFRRPPSACPIQRGRDFDEGGPAVRMGTPNAPSIRSVAGLATCDRLFESRWTVRKQTATGKIALLNLRARHLAFVAARHLRGELPDQAEGDRQRAARQSRRGAKDDCGPRSPHRGREEAPRRASWGGGTKSRRPRASSESAAPRECRTKGAWSCRNYRNRGLRSGPQGPAGHARARRGSETSRLLDDVLPSPEALGRRNVVVLPDARSRRCAVGPWQRGRRTRARDGRCSWLRTVPARCRTAVSRGRMNSQVRPHGRLQR